MTFALTPAARQVIQGLPGNWLQVKKDGVAIGNANVEVIDIVGDPNTIKATRGVGENSHVVTIWRSNIRTIVLLHFNGADASVAIVDAVVANTWNNAANGAISAALAKYGSGAYDNASFAGPGAISVNNIEAIGSSDYTIELWFKTTFNSTCYLMNFEDANGFSLSLTSGDLRLTGPVGTIPPFSTLYAQTSGLALADDAWHFVQVTRDNVDVAKIYVDGVLRATGRDQTSHPTKKLAVMGIADGSGPLMYVGTVDDFRLSLGARINAVPIAELTL